MADKHPCESCSMPIETGAYCQHCVTASGELQPFDERFERMVGRQLARQSGLSRDQAERETLSFMARMPAWKNHPKLTAALKARH